MLIPVLYENKKLGMVYPTRLDRLIAENKILAFRRSTGWVFLDEDPVRKNQNDGEYTGPERRSEITHFRQLENIMQEHEIIYEGG